MNSKNRAKLNKAIEILNGLHFKNENIMVTGSIALDAHGLLTGRIAHDVDLIIKMDEQSWRCLKLIEAITLADEDDKFKDYDTMAGKKTVFLKADGLVLNIWKYDEGTDWSEIKDAETGVYVATVEHIIEAKKKYARDKDIIDIYNITKSIL
jgi:hypothetical protein